MDEYDFLYKRTKALKEQEGVETSVVRKKPGRPRKELSSSDYERYRDNIRRAVLKYDQANPARYIFQHVRAAAKRRGIEFSIEVSDIVIPEYCPMLGCKLTMERGKGKIGTNASLDRIDSTKGYIKGNVQVLSSLANYMKNNATPEQLVIFAENILRIYKKP